MTRDELLRDAQEARSLGDSDLELSILEKLDNLPQEQPKEISAADYAKNMLYGAAARGNQAIAAINPWADLERIKQEQEWVKQNAGAGLGETLADVAITAPAGGAATLAGRALLTGGIEGLTNTGGFVDKVKDAGYGAMGSGVGEKIGDAAGFLLQPFKKTANIQIQKLIDKAKDIGLPLNAAQVTGNKSLQYADSALDFIPSSSSAQQEFKDLQRKVWQNSLFKQGGENADAATPEAMGAMKDRISGVYDDVTSRNALTVDSQLKSELSALKQKYINEKLPTDQRGIVKSYLNDFDQPPIGADIKGDTYQKIRSRLDKRAKSFKNSDPDTYQALKDIRLSIDSAMERSLSNPSRLGGNADDLANWKKANKDWLVMKNIEQNIQDPVTGEISPNKLMSALKKDSNRVVYGKGDQELTDIAKLGKQFIAPKTNDSGTAQRAQMIRLLTGAELTGLGVGAFVDPVTTGLVGGGLLGTQVLLPKTVGRMMRNPNGYLSEGLLDMSKKSIGNKTRQEIVNSLLRNAGIQAQDKIRE